MNNSRILQWFSNCINSFRPLYFDKRIWHPLSQIYFVCISQLSDSECCITLWSIYFNTDTSKGANIIVYTRQDCQAQSDIWPEALNLMKYSKAKLPTTDDLNCIRISIIFYLPQLLQWLPRKYFLMDKEFPSKYLPRSSSHLIRRYRLCS